MSWEVGGLIRAYEEALEHWRRVEQTGRDMGQPPSVAVTARIETWEAAIRMARKWEVALAEEDDVNDCEHVPAAMRYQIIPGKPRGAIDVKCPCCGLGAWVEDVADLADSDPCPYCGVEAVQP